ncbi:unnamed protein product, partial [Rotaria sp. Silwood1]
MVTSLGEKPEDNATE